jgi:hypothetical protein
MSGYGHGLAGAWYEEMEGEIRHGGRNVSPTFDG